MRAWILASICTLGLSFMNSKLFHSHSWSAYDYFIATVLLAIFLKMND